MNVTRVSFSTPPKGVETVTGLNPLTMRFSPAGPVAVTVTRWKLVFASSNTVAVPAGTGIGCEH